MTNDQLYALRRVVVEQSADLVAVLDVDGRIVEWNRAAERAFGRPADELLGRPIDEVSAEYGATPAERGLLRSVLRGDMVRYETRRRDAHGDAFDLSVVVSPLRGPEGEFAGAVAVARDITAQRAAERERDRAAARARFLAGASQLLASSLDLDETLVAIGRLTVPEWADVTALALRDAEGRLEAPAVECADAALREPALAAFARHARAPRPGGLLERTLSTGRPVLVPDVGDSSPGLRALGARSLVLAPLRVRGSVIGVLFALMTAGSRRRFEEVDVDLLQDVADRAAQAIDNARLLLAEREARAAAERAALEAQAADARFRAAFEHAPAGIALVRAELQLGLVYAEVNPALCEIAGHPRDALVGRPVNDFLHPEDREPDLHHVGRLLRGDVGEVVRELRHVRPDGEVRWVRTHVAPLLTAGGPPETFVAQVEDITDRRRFELRLEHLASRDALTGLLNRRRFEEELGKACSAVGRHGDRAAVLVFDLDNFKHVNDTYGHATGDRLLRAVAQELSGRVRATDAAGRLGGDEFGVLLSRTSLDEATDVAHVLLETIRTEVRVSAGARTVRVTASAGLRALQDGPLSPGDLLGEADMAMYDAKDRGRDRLSVVGSGDLRPERVRARMRWAERIRDALDHDRFVLYEQPILDLRSRDVDRAELLVRMVGEDGEPIPPAAFLPVAERYGHIRALDRWVVRHAIALLEERQALGGAMAAAVNLSGDSLTDASVVDFIVSEIRNAGIDATALTFEVTETAAIGNLERARRLARQLADLGCTFALDDFGAGFGSFAYLKHLPFESIKIDGEFIRTLPRSPSDQVTVRAVVDVARALDKQTVGEFVEDEETLVLLQRLGVDGAQGYHVGVPRPAAARPVF